MSSRFSIILTVIVLIIAAALSALGAYFSIFGLTTIFAAAKNEVIALGVLLEATKVSSAAWMHLHWSKLSRLVRGYLVIAISILMFITSAGIYGYLSKAFIEQQTRIVLTNGPQLQALQLQIDNQKQLKADADSQIRAIDDKLKQVKGRTGLAEIRRQQQSRDKLVKQQQQHVTELFQLQQQQLQLQSAQRRIEQEIGPIRYIAKAIPWLTVDNEAIVRMMILMIMFVFDPLAIILVVATTGLIASVTQKQLKVTTEGTGSFDIDINKIIKSANSTITISALDLTKAKI